MTNVGYKNLIFVELLRNFSLLFNNLGESKCIDILTIYKVMEMMFTYGHDSLESLKMHSGCTFIGFLACLAKVTKLKDAKKDMIH